MDRSKRGLLSNKADTTSCFFAEQLLNCATAVFFFASSSKVTRNMSVEALPLKSAQEDQLQASAFATVDAFEIKTPPGTTVRAKVVDIYDSDSCHINLFLPGMGLTQLHLRLRRVDGPEVRSRRAVEKKAAIIARDALLAFVLGAPPSIHKPRLRTPDVRTLLALCPQEHVRVALGGTDKFGRVLAELWNEGRNAADWMLLHGLVMPYCGGKKPRFTDAHLAEVAAKNNEGFYAGDVKNMTRTRYEADRGRQKHPLKPPTIENI